jgi:hypothetical protein
MRGFFEARVTAFAGRFLSDRTFALIVAPALADLQFDDSAGRGLARNYVAVLRALAGGIFDEVSRDTASFVVLTMLPMSYYTALLVVFWDFFATTGGVLLTVTLIAVLSLGPVMACFWPAPHRPQPID